MVFTLVVTLQANSPANANILAAKLVRPLNLSTKSSIRANSVNFAGRSSQKLPKGRWDYRLARLARLEG